MKAKTRMECLLPDDRAKVQDECLTIKQKNERKNDPIAYCLITNNNQTIEPKRSGISKQ